MSKKIGNLKGEPGKQADTPVIPWPRGGGSGVIVQDEGTNLNAGKIVSAVDFEGAGVTAAMSGTKAVVTIPGGGGGGGVTVTGSGGEGPFSATNIQGPVAEDAGGGSVILKSVIFSDTDPGAVGAGQLWLFVNATVTDHASQYQLYIRSDNDASWLPVGVGDHGGTGGPPGSGDEIQITAMGADPDPWYSYARLDLRGGTSGQIDLSNYDETFKLRSHLSMTHPGIVLAHQDATGLETASVALQDSGTLITGPVGFYGTSPVAQPAAPTTLGDVIAALKALGLVAS